MISVSPCAQLDQLFTDLVRKIAPGREGRHDLELLLGMQHIQGLKPEVDLSPIEYEWRYTQSLTSV